MPYDPRDYGARCDLCPLGPQGALRKDDWEPVGPELHDGATTLAVSDHPGPEDTLHQRPMIGRNGSAWSEALQACGKRRPDVDLTNVIECKLPGGISGASLRLKRSLEKLNKRRVAEGAEPLPHPATCCRPRLLELSSNYTNVITLGRAATEAITGSSSNIFAMRGGPVQVGEHWTLDDEGERKVVPTLHPSYVLRVPAWRDVLHRDLGKAFRWFEGRLRWQVPDILWRPTPDQLREWLSQPAPFWAYDVETDGIVPTETNIRTIAIAIPDLDAQGRIARHPDRPIAQNSRAVGVTLTTVQGARWYDSETEAEILDILRTALTNGRMWVGHNAGSFDRMVVENNWGVTPMPLLDTLFLTRIRAPELPKSLKTIGSILTDVDRWESTEKGESIATGTQGDDELLKYNCIDACVNARIMPPLLQAGSFNGAFRPLPEWARPEILPAGSEWSLHTLDHITQNMCVAMHKTGIWVDQVKRQQLEDQFSLSVARRKRRLVEMAREWHPKFDNPNSGAQVRDLFYGRWNLSIPSQMDARSFYTESGLPGTGDAVVRGHLSDGNLTETQVEWLMEIRQYRREVNKILGTVLIPMRRRDRDPKRGKVFRDGRVRSNWNAHTTAVGRLSSSGPNLQNIGNRKGQGPLKKIFGTPPGRAFIGADLDQAHLRITACYWNIPLLLECFADGKDPHNTLAYSVFGNAFKNASGWGPDGFSLYRKPTAGQALSMRNIIKTFRYASIYWADPSTVWSVLTSTETDDGKLPYLNYSLREVRFIHEQWLESEPEWMVAWKQMQHLYRNQGWMEEPVFRRRSGILSGGKKNEVVNYPILAAEASIMRIAEHRVMAQFPFDFGGPGTGIVHQCHDSITVEVPDAGEAQLKKWTKELEESMTIVVPRWCVPMTAEGGFGKTLKEV